MIDTKNFNTILNLNLSSNQQSILIFSTQLSARFNYVCEFIFNHVLNVHIAFTSNIEEFEASPLCKLNYSNLFVSKCVTIIPHTLIFENKVTDLKPIPFFNITKNGDKLIYFFKNTVGDLNYDIFSSVFYFISRYEEWQIYQADTHQRFEAKSSLLYQNKFHLIPVVEHWILELKGQLQKVYPTLTFPPKKFKSISTIDVDNLYAFKNKGIVRTLGAAAKDVIKLDFINLKNRILVLLDLKKDPFAIYETISQLCLENNIPLIYFFLLKTGTPFDRTVNPHSQAFDKLFQIIENKKAHIGLHPSYYSAYEANLLNEEIEILNKKLKNKVTFSRQHYLRFDIKTTPNLLLKHGITKDFSMGFASTIGFRAGTSIPFYYYDFSSEHKTDLLFVPFSCMDGAYFVYNTINAKDAFQSLYNLALEIKKVNGLFISVFHERSFYNHLYKGFGTLYKKLHHSLKELESL